MGCGFWHLSPRCCLHIYACTVGAFLPASAIPPPPSVPVPFSLYRRRRWSREDEHQVGVQEGRGSEWEDVQMGRWGFCMAMQVVWGVDVPLPVSVFICMALPCLPCEGCTLNSWVFTQTGETGGSFVGTNNNKRHFLTLLPQD